MLNLMFQYRPCGQAYEVPALALSPSQKDFEMALQAAKEEGIIRLDKPKPGFLLWSNVA